MTYVNLHMKKVIASVFMNGKNQAIRFPKSMKIDSDKVSIRPIGNGFMVEPEQGEKWTGIKFLLDEASESFPSREVPVEQQRDLRW